LIQQPAERVSYRTRVVRAVVLEEPAGYQAGNLAVPDFDWNDTLAAFAASTRQAHPVGGPSTRMLRVTGACDIGRTNSSR